MTTNNETDIMTASIKEPSASPDVDRVVTSSSVNNPYTFSITKNVAFSAICEEDWSGGGK